MHGECQEIFCPGDSDRFVCHWQVGVNPAWRASAWPLPFPACRPTVQQPRFAARIHELGKRPLIEARFDDLAGRSSFAGFTNLLMATHQQPMAPSILNWLQITGHRPPFSSASPSITRQKLGATDEEWPGSLLCSPTGQDNYLCHG